jgi:hypothetical protein
VAVAANIRNEASYRNGKGLIMIGGLPKMSDTGAQR